MVLCDVSAGSAVSAVVGHLSPLLPPARPSLFPPHHRPLLSLLQEFRVRSSLVRMRSSLVADEI